MFLAEDAVTTKARFFDYNVLKSRRLQAIKAVFAESPP